MVAGLGLAVILTGRGMILCEVLLAELDAFRPEIHGWEYSYERVVTRTLLRISLLLAGPCRCTMFSDWLGRGSRLFAIGGGRGAQDQQPLSRLISRRGTNGMVGLMRRV